MKIRAILNLVLLSAALPSCTLDPVLDPLQVEDKHPYRFFVAGHAYGHPEEAIDSLGLYPPFFRKMPALDADPLMELGVFTGDVVRVNEEFRYDTLARQLVQFDLDYHVVPGNHDTETGRSYENFTAWFGPSWYSKRIHGDLFLFLDPNLDRWRISSEQIEMIASELDNLHGVRNVFVFTHQVLWWNPEPDSAFHAFGANSPDGRADSLNFWNAVLPPFRSLEQEVWFFAGDVNAWCYYEPAGYYQSGNIHLLTSGMGCETRSNYLEVSLNEEHEASVRIVWIGTVPGDSLGDLEDWRITP